MEIFLGCRAVEHFNECEYGLVVTPSNLNDPKRMWMILLHYWRLFFLPILCEPDAGVKAIFVPVIRMGGNLLRQGSS